MKKYAVLTLFPEMIDQTLSHSITGRAMEKGLFSVKSVNIRDFSHNKHKNIDDTPYGGGAGMVMQAPPIYDAYQSIKSEFGDCPVIYMSPQGKSFNQKMAEELLKEDNIIFLCGHYEGVDERIIEEIVTHEISIGDFVLTGGELPAITIIDSISRLIPGVLGKVESFEDESFTNGLLEYPHYTRPFDFRGKIIPDILMSGHHKNIDIWRKNQSILRTWEKRPDLLENYDLSTFSKEELNFFNSLKEYDKESYKESDKESDKESNQIMEKN